jgi:integrase
MLSNQPTRPLAVRPQNARAKPKATHNDIVLIKQLVNFEVRRGMIRENPLKELKLGQPKRTPQPYWTRDQVDVILTAAGPKYRAVFRFLADTGCRIGEAEWLTWEDVDFANRIVHIREKDGWHPKTGDMQVIPISPALETTLKNLSQISPWVFTAAPSRQYPNRGHQISPRRALAHVKTVLKKLGLKGHLHTFRHSFISHALISGVPEAIVRKWAGHVDPEIIRIYTHIADQQSRDALDQIFPDDPSASQKVSKKSSLSTRAQKGRVA